MDKNTRLCLMSCCAPCSAGAVIEIAKMKEQGDIADAVVLFYNPNIFPEGEYQKRLYEQIKLCNQVGLPYVVGQWDHGAWLECVRGLENEPERGNRCAACFKMRFDWGVNWALNNGFNAVTSVFGISRHKDQAQVDTAATAAIMGDIKYIPIDWDKTLYTDENRRHDFYRQTYCGCEFSMKK